MMIKDMKDEKRILEDEIRDLLNEFIEKTGLTVRSVAVTTPVGFGSDNGRIVYVNVDARLC